MGNIKLYKYLDVNGGLMMLHNSNLQFTNATRLNDPFDCHPALFDFSHAPECPFNWPPKDFMLEKGESDTENLRNSAWICNLSKIHDFLMMWSYYGNHKGVCVGLDIEEVNKYLSRILCSIYGAMEMEVQYRDVIDKPDYFRDPKDFFRYQLSTKAKAWEHEQEVRLLLIDPIPDGASGHPCFAPMALPYKPKSKKEAIDWKEVRAYPHLGGECFDSLYLVIRIARWRKEKRESIIAEARKCIPAIKVQTNHDNENNVKKKQNKTLSNPLKSERIFIFAVIFGVFYPFNVLIICLIETLVRLKII